MIVDIVIPVKPAVKDLVVAHTIPSILKHLACHTIYVIARKNVNNAITQQITDSRVQFIDEDLVVDGLTFQWVTNYLLQKIDHSDQAGWYFQQFLKLGMAERPEVTENYLVWDADSILLRPIAMFDNRNRVLVTKSFENHTPYFDTINKLLDIKKQVSWSFISEHMLFNKVHVKSMLDRIARHSDDAWWKVIMDNVDIKELHSCGFSEYESYGNYVMNRYPGYFKFRQLAKLRHGRKYLGSMPNTKDLENFSKYYDYVSIERWDNEIKPEFWRHMRLYWLILKRRCNGFLSTMTGDGSTENDAV